MESIVTVDAADRTLREEIVRARDALLELASERPGHWWSARDLKVQARNGWDSGVMGLALSELLEEGLLEQRSSDLRVRKPK
jgi:hypothetical protein